MNKRKAGHRVVIAALSLLACASIGAYLAFVGFNGHPETVSADDRIQAAPVNHGSKTAPPEPQPSATPSTTTQIVQSSNSDSPEGDGKSGQTFNDWTIRCQKNEAGEIVSCEAFQRLSVRETGQRFLELAIGFPPGSETPLAIFVLPLGLWLPPGMDFQIDDGDPLKAPIQRCIQGGCLVQIPLTDDLLAEMKRGQQLAIQVYRQQDDPLAVPISLIGFTAALDEIR